VSDSLPRFGSRCRTGLPAWRACSRVRAGVDDLAPSAACARSRQRLPAAVADPAACVEDRRRHGLDRTGEGAAGGMRRAVDARCARSGVARRARSDPRPLVLGPLGRHRAPSTSSHGTRCPQHAQRHLSIATLPLRTRRRHAACMTSCQSPVAFTRCGWMTGYSRAIVRHREIV
jgi:hypothetical protein